MSPQALDLPFEDIREGQEAHEEYLITPALTERFLASFGDLGPMMRGAILNGFLSHLVGMRLPGRRALLLSADLRYLQPSHLGDRIRLDATVVQRVEASRAIVLDVDFHNQTQQVLVARARVLVAVAALPPVSA